MSFLTKKLSLLPKQPGCYLMKNKKREVIYVGKAKNLRNRVRSYFSGSHSGKVQRLVMQIADFEYIVTKSPLEALVLEAELIKKYRPRFNSMLKDDKSYPYIRLTNEEHPRLEITRNVVNDGSKYFGPYPDVKAAQHTKKLLDKLYPLRKCRQLPKKVCLYYHLDQCLAPCVFPVSQAEYRKISKQIVQFLKGGHRKVQKKLEEEMLKAAEALAFEKAKELRDLIESINKVMEEQRIVFQDYIDRDVFGYAAQKGWMCVQVFFVRQGKLITRKVSIFPSYQQDSIEDFHSFIAQFYYDAAHLPKEILFPKEIDESLIQDLLPDVKIRVPKRGIKRDLVEMAEENARIALAEKLKLMEQDEQRTTLALKELSEALELDHLDRIEAFDHSNIQGTAPVSAMVVFLSGRPAKKEYRKYKIRSVQKPDDYEMMREVIRRRYTRVLKENLPLPDLILVDGGKGQLSAARAVLKDELGLSIPVAGMVKDEKHKTAYLLYGDQIQKKVPIAKGSQAFYLLQRIQEEAHRFAITYHRKQRGKAMLRSILDEIPGVGPKRKQLLYQHFGSIEKMKQASLEEYRKIGIGEKLANTILKYLAQHVTTDDCQQD